MNGSYRLDTWGVVEKHSKTPTNWTDANRSSQITKNRVEAALYNNNRYKGGCTDKWKTIDADNPSIKSDGKHCTIHCARNSSKECKFISDFGKMVCLAAIKILQVQTN